MVQQVNQQEAGLSESDVHMFELNHNQILVLDLKLMPLVPAGRMKVQASNLPTQNIVQTFLI